jgi:hypothetical protein
VHNKFVRHKVYVYKTQMSIKLNVIKTVFIAHVFIVSIVFKSLNKSIIVIVKLYVAKLHETMIK